MYDIMKPLSSFLFSAPVNRFANFLNNVNGISELTSLESLVCY